jgi:polyisoprenyl-teichoic acid--peptidoglycan teichoic acid transferase
VRWKRLLWALLAVLGLVLVVVGIWFLRVVSAASGSGGVGKLLQAFEDPRKLFPGKDRIVILVLGKDYNRDKKGMPYTKGSRADTIMLMGLDLINPHLSAVSIPRDTKITAPDGITGKINSVMSRGGPELMMQTLSQHFGIPVDYYVVLKPDAVRSIVDKLGGVDVETLDEMNYDDSWGQLHIHLPKGKVHLNGAAAEGFVRFRKTEPGQRHHRGPNLEEGDLRRAARQQQMIHAMVRAGMRAGNIINMPSVIQTGFQQIETNLAQAQLAGSGRN